MQPNYHILTPKGRKVPILVSIPHCGTAFPEDIIQHYQPAMVDFPDDTDFFLDKVYDFVLGMGITLIHAPYNRWVIDLNRSPEHQALYTDGRLLTALTPTTDFLGRPIYIAPQFEPDNKEIERRKALYFYPYYRKIREILTAFQQTFGAAILWDAHSIRRVVPTIQATPFPDFILGTNDGATASETFVKAAQKGLATSQKSVFYNHPFKGGNITRHFGNPKVGIHAMQLEMIKTLYMNDEETHYHPERANELKNTLKNTFELLIKSLG